MANEKDDILESAVKASEMLPVVVAFYSEFYKEKNGSTAADIHLDKHIRTAFFKEHFGNLSTLEEIKKVEIDLIEEVKRLMREKYRHGKAAESVSYFKRLIKEAAKGRCDQLYDQIEIE